MDNELLVKSIRKLCKENNITPAQLETKLPEAPFIDEWEDLKSSKKYVDGTDLEQLLPITFSVMYIVAIIIISRGR